MVPPPTVCRIISYSYDYPSGPYIDNLAPDLSVVGVCLGSVKHRSGTGDMQCTVDGAGDTASPRQRKRDPTDQGSICAEVSIDHELRTEDLSKVSSIVCTCPGGYTGTTGTFCGRAGLPEVSGYLYRKHVELTEVSGTGIETIPNTCRCPLYFLEGDTCTRGTLGWPFRTEPMCRAPVLKIYQPTPVRFGRVFTEKLPPAECGTYSTQQTLAPVSKKNRSDPTMFGSSRLQLL